MSNNIDQHEEGAAYLQPWQIVPQQKSTGVASDRVFMPAEAEVNRLKENEARHLNAIREAMRTIEKYTSLNGETPCGNHVYNDLRQHLAATNNL